MINSLRTNKRSASIPACFAGLIVTALTSLMSMQASAETKNQAFLDQAIARWQSLRQTSSLTILAQGQTGYLPLRELIVGQDEVSVDNMLRKLEERETALDLSPNNQAGKKNWRLHHHGGRSLAPVNDPITVIRTSEGYVIADGHHDFYLSLFVGATTIPVRVIDDLSTLSPLEAWTKLKSEKLVYLRRSESELALSSPRVEDVRDNPNRYLAALIALKVATQMTNGQLTVTDVKSHKKPVWIKVGDGVPFIEFYIAQVLKEAGIEYDPRWGKDVPDEIIERARTALLQTSREGRLEPVVKTPILHSEAAAAPLLVDHERLAGELRAFAGAGACRAVFSKRR